MRSITEKTLIPISAIGVVVGGVFWLTMLYFQTNANAKALADLSLKQDTDLKAASIKQEEYVNILNRIDTRLAIIETEVKRMSRAR
jgi:hypothetical protein